MAKDILFKTIMLKGEAGGTITSIEKISAEGGVMQMRIYLSDGSEVDFPVNDVPDTEAINQLIDAAITTYNNDVVQGISDTVEDLTTIVRSTLLAGGWSISAPYSYTLTVSGVTAQDNYEVVGFDPTGTAADDKAIKEALGFITYGTTGAGTITFIAVEDKPLVDIPIVLRKVVG